MAIEDDILATLKVQFGEAYAVTCFCLVLRDAHVIYNLDLMCASFGQAVPPLIGRICRILWPPWTATESNYCCLKRYLQCSEPKSHNLLPSD